MMPHPNVEQLSTYLDEELESRDRQRLEEHLAECDACRRRLRGLDRVVRDLRSLERLTPPPHLGPELRRVAALEYGKPTLVERLEQGVARVNLYGALLPLFGVVLALVVILYLLSLGVARRDRAFVPTAPEELAASPDTIAAPARPGDRRFLANREFVYQEDLWIEAGLEAVGSFERIRLDAPKFEALLAEHPELRELVDLRVRARILVDGRALEIEP